MADIVAVTLLRHGITRANLERRYLGWTDIPLLESEIQKLKAVQRFGQQFDYCVTSDLQRAKRTAEMLCPQLEKLETRAFRELHFGEWEMKTYDDLKSNLDYRAWIDAPESITPPGGESFQAMKERVDAGFEQLRVTVLEHGIRNILLVAHGGVIRYLLTKLTTEDKQFFEWSVSHDAGIRLIWEIDNWKGGGKCISFQEVPLMAREDG